MSFKVVGVGEVLWDLLPEGPQFGGAPANFAYYAKQLGAQALVVSCVGNDTHGREIFHRLRELGFDANTLQVNDRLPTGTATAVLDSDGTPRFTITENVAWDGLELAGEAFDAAGKADAIRFGTLAQRGVLAASTIQKLVAATPFSSIRLFDVNLRPLWSWDCSANSLSKTSAESLRRWPAMSVPVLVPHRCYRSSIRQLAKR